MGVTGRMTVQGAIGVTGRMTVQRCFGVCDWPMTVHRGVGRGQRGIKRAAGVMS